MAKKKQTNKNQEIQELSENALPQNIFPVGESVTEDKKIYILQATYKTIQKFTKNKTKVESGGMLVGSVIEEFGKANILIKGFVEAKYCDATPTTLKFTHETWEYVHSQIEKKYPGQKIVGWIHTHPDFGIFLSEYDKFIQQNFFSEENQVAYVIDPIKNEEGFYFWINGNLTECKGFYIYDKEGVKIKVSESNKGLDNDDEEEEEEEEGTSWLTWKNVLIAILTVAVIFLGISNISMKNDVEQLQEQVQTMNTQVTQMYNIFGSLFGIQTTPQEQPEQTPSDTEAATPTDTTIENGLNGEGLK